MKQDNFLISAYGVRMPKLIYGTAWKKGRTSALVGQAIGLGFRGIDTACQNITLRLVLVKGSLLV
jgi:diketogulonate reductase-like aldo/keto reductase